MRTGVTTQWHLFFYGRGCALSDLFEWRCRCARCTFAKGGPGEKVHFPWKMPFLLGMVGFGLHSLPLITLKAPEKVQFRGVEQYIDKYKISAL